MSILQAAVSGVVLIGLATAVGLHGKALGSFMKSSGQATAGVLHTAETGKN